MDLRRRIFRYLSFTFIVAVLSLVMNTERMPRLSPKTTITPDAQVNQNRTVATLALSSLSQWSSSSSSHGKIEEEIGWWNKYVPRISRVYNRWNGTTPHGWCISSQATPIPKMTDPPGEGAISGLIYVKSPKASSSTGQGITANIAHHVGRQMFPLSEVTSTSSGVVPCTYYSHHPFAGNKGHGRPRQRDTSLLWTTVRHPAARDLSGVMYFRVRNGMEPTEENMIQVLSGMIRGVQVKYLLPSKKLEKRVKPDLIRAKPEMVAKIVQKHILEYYDFIGVTERMDESLAVMTLLWGLDATDVIVLSSKQAGGYAPVNTNRGYDKDGTKSKTTPSPGCMKIPKVNRTRAIDEFFQSDAYKSTNTDLLLYHAAVASLDRTIDELGRDVVQDRVNYIRQLQQLAESECNHVAQFPCSPLGEMQKQLADQSCYTTDAGCGYKCVDKVLLHSRTIPFIY